MKRKYRNRFVNLLSGGERIEQPKNVVSDDRAEATIYIYDEISWWWLGAEWFVNQINTMADVPVINVRVNSPGGDYFEAKAMQTAMAQHPSEFIVHIDGMAASAASFFIRGANKRVMTNGGFIMIHRSSGGVWGGYKDMLSYSKLLEQIDDSIINGNMVAAGVDKEQATKWVDNETWFGAEEALEYGFIDEIIEAEPAKNSFDLKSIYKNVPESIKDKAEDTPDKEKDQNVKQCFDISANLREIELLEMEQ